MPNSSLFYSWESDRPSILCRAMIRGALDSALGRIVADVNVEDSPRLDSDTTGTPGTPEIAGTIFSKIDGCSGFIADVTSIGQTPTRSVQNPNVLLELGYAAARIGWDRIICVFNEYYGTPNDLPFDLRNRRWPVLYRCTDTMVPDERRAIRDRLSVDLERAIRALLNAEHDLAVRTTRLLDVDTLYLLRELGRTDYFAAHRTGAHPDTERLNPLIRRLLDLRLLWCDISSQGDEYAYHWTRLGILVLKRLRIRGEDTPTP